MQEKRALSPRVVRYTNSILRSAPNYAIDLDLVIRNEAARCKLPQLIPREMTIFTQNEVRLFLKSAKSERLFALFSFLLGTGCRPAEALGLKWADVDFEKSSVVIRRALVWQRSGGSWAFCEPKTKKVVFIKPTDRSHVFTESKLTFNTQIGEIRHCVFF
jgi:integrase